MIWKVLSQTGSKPNRAALNALSRSGLSLYISSSSCEMRSLYKRKARLFSEPRQVLPSKLRAKLLALDVVRSDCVNTFKCSVGQRINGLDH
jgi:hypothetical protein